MFKTEAAGSNLDVVLGDDDLAGVGEVDEEGESQHVDVVNRHLRLVLLYQIVCKQTILDQVVSGEASTLL
jgi:hypothetical protein